MITPLDNTIKGVMEFTWPMIAICVLTLASIRITYLIKNEKEFVLYREIFNLFFLIYILCLFQIVTFEDTSTIIDGNNLVPFREIFRYKIGSRLFYKNVVGNMVLFVPYGIFTGMYTKIEKQFHAFCLVLYASVIVEVTQLLIGRIFDIDDILLNIIGGFVGFKIYYYINKIGDSVPRVFRSKWFLNILSTLFVCLLLSYIWMVVLG